MSESKALATTTHDIGIMELGGVLAKSGFFADSKDVSKAVVKVLAGRELGFGPIASMTGIYIIKGKPSISANMMAQAVKRSDRYDYHIVELTPERCEIVFTERGKEIGRSMFTKEDARQAGTQNMAKFPRNMLFSRAMSNGVKWYCPDVFHTGVYTPEEMGAPVDADGDVIEGTFTATTTTDRPTTDRPTAPKTNGNGGEKWYAFAARACKELGYNHTAHVVNTLQKETGEDGPFWGEQGEIVGNPTDLWTVLVDHQEAKEKPIDDKAINRILSGDDPNPVPEL